MDRIKCKIDCQSMDCNECATIAAEHNKWLKKMMIFEESRIVGVSDTGLYNCLIDAQKEKDLSETKIKFYEEKLRERGLSPDGKKIHPREWDAWSC